MLEAMNEAFGEDLIARPAAEVRAVMDGFGADARPPRPAGVSVEERTFEVTEGREIPVRIYRPGCPEETSANGGGLRPVLAYFHGGGWVLGNLETHDRLCCALAVESGVVIVSVDYRLAPENRFPEGLRDCMDATFWLATHGPDLGLDPSRLAVGGDSAGGNLAAAVALIARERDMPPLAFQLLFYPAVDTDFDRPSYIENAEGPVLTRDFARWFWQQYLGPEIENPTPLAAPLLATDFGDLPPAYVLTLEHDPLRDEGEAYARRLVDANVQVEAHRAQRLFHGCLRAVGLSPLVDAEIIAAGKALAAALQGIR
jgi:acetyl esterase